MPGLLIGDIGIDADPRPPDDPDSSATIDFSIPKDFQIATQPLRVRIDGAQTRLTQDGNPASPTYGQFFPQIQVMGP